MPKYGEFLYGETQYGSEQLWIYNRKQSDLKNNTKKAFINYQDLNRIETRMSELTALLNQYLYVQSITTKTDWEKVTNSNFATNTPTLSHINRLHDNEQKLINAFFVYPTTPTLPVTFEYLDIYRMNNVEKILRDLYMMVLDMVSYFRECDTFYCGED